MKTLLTTLVVIILALGGWLLYANRDTDTTAPGADTTQNFPMATSTAATSTGSTNSGSNSNTSGSNNSGTQVKTADIVITSPLSGATVASPLTVSGKAKGTWFFEASAPLYLTDESGKKLAQSHITATEDWMTTNFVPFTGTLTWATTTGTSTRGYIVFENDNPSGNPDLQKSVRVPVVFR